MTVTDHQGAVGALHDDEVDAVPQVIGLFARQTRLQPPRRRQLE